MASFTSFITDGAFRDHSAFWTAALGTLADDFHFRQPWLSTPPGASAAVERLQLAADAAATLRQIGGGTDLGLFAVLASALSLLLETHAGVHVVAIDTPPLPGGVDAAAIDGAIPLVLSVDPAHQLREHLSRTADVVAQSYSYQQFPIAQAAATLLGRARPRTNVFASVDGLHEAGRIAGDYDLRVVVTTTPALILTLEGQSPAFSPAFLRTLARHLDNVLAAYAADLSTVVGRVDLMGPDERQRLLVDYNRTGAADLSDQTIHELFAEQVRRDPAQVAIRLGDEAIDYASLHRLSNQLARSLQADYGVGPGDVVGVVVHRSPLTIAALLGVLKAGAIYLPIDPEYPEERLQFMVTDSAVKALLVHSEHFEKLASLYETPMFALDLQLGTLDTPSGDLAASTGPDAPAYIIYTSGSTGLPKAVLLEHRGFVNMVRHHVGAFGIGPTDRLLQFYGLSFDSSLFEIFVSLLSGATLVMVPRETINDPEQLSAAIDAQQVTTLTLPPVYQSSLDRSRLTSVRRFVSAGDTCKVEDATAFARRAAYYNSYGPTECSVCVTHYQVNPVAPQGSRIPIGKPISHTSIYLLDDDLQPVPEGVAGEICVGGVSLARGYLKRDELTAAAFVASPFIAGERLYRTGDLGVWLPDGNLELIGRKDNQVKIRGYRVELGEIEAVLLQAAGVREAAVLAREDESGHKRLVAYVSGERSLDTAAIKTLLRSRLPDFMVPALFVVLDTMPLTANGKIDRKALPAPAAAVADDPLRGLPQNETQARLLAVWRDVLGIETIGVHDNLFELGGDSIVAIQIVSRARQAGLKLVPNQLFEHQTIATLSEVATVAEPLRADDGPLDGPCPLGPMQEWFFERAASEPHHFNQSVLLELADDLSPEAAAAATRALVAHHDALRLRFRQTDGRWSAHYTTATADVPFSMVDLSSLPHANQDVRMREAIEAAQTGLDLAAGPLLRIVLFQRGHGLPQRLFVAVHHLVVDGVSWRILLEDFRALCGAPGTALPPRTTSYRAWTSQLREHSDVFADERQYWLSPERSRVEPILVDVAPAAGAAAMATTRELLRVLDAEQTSALLFEAPRAYSTDVGELLLTAVATGLAEWSERDRVLIDVEAHGRENLTEDEFDLSRTVGWFTSQFPLLLTVDRDAPIGSSLKSIKEQFRAVPRRGAGFGVLRYLAGDSSFTAAVTALPQAPVLFNYVGRSGETDPRWRLLPSTGSDVSPRSARTHLIDVNAIVNGDHLELAWTFSTAVFRQETIERLADRCDGLLRALIAHCRNVDSPQFTPSDFPAASLDQNALDALIAKISRS